MVVKMCSVWLTISMIFIEMLIVIIEVEILPLMYCFDNIKICLMLIFPCIMPSDHLMMILVCTLLAMLNICFMVVFS